MKTMPEDNKKYIKRKLKCISNKMLEDYLKIGEIYTSEYDYIWDTYAIKVDGETLFFNKEMFEEVS
ncbi:hypothetical protein GOM49_17765 [Clostridium bovifaecis]|uniref:Uncharacterized protein n=1 Tax=Clostridium bovifaecis TaxID=2184719 RepID=A0A6I6EWG3_9CLOT|nr:hypothetical protein GOM49_17765 [Clostridium bovifaecis]